MPAKFEARIFSRFGAISINAVKFTGSHDRDHTHFSEIFVRDMSGVRQLVVSIEDNAVHVLTDKIN